MRRSDWLTFSAVILIIAGIPRVIDAIWAFGYHSALPDGPQGALLGHSLTASPGNRPAPIMAGAA
jgi:hypothetical protein